MDAKIPTWAHRVFIKAAILFLGIFSISAQTLLEEYDTDNSYHVESMSYLISSFQLEENNKLKRYSSLFAKSEWGKIKKLGDGSDIALHDIGEDGTLLYYTTLNDPTNQVSRAQSLYSDGILELGLNGRNMEVGVWDSGVALNTHQEFNGRSATGDSSNEISPHATLVTGNIISSGVKAKARGVAYGAKAITHNWTRDKIEVAEAAASGLLLSNHSYGIKSDRVPDWYFGAYIKVSQDWDKIMYNAPYYLMVNAAGNAQKSYDNASPIYGKSADGFDLMLGFTTAKNAITVAGANTKLGKDGELLEANIAGYSSLGPIDDGRIKPDLAGDGSAIFSTTSQSNTSYGTSTGTSMAAPGVTGSLLLLQQYHNQLFGNYMKAATLKGLALHTADDVGSKGPDYKMGWGVLNAQAAAEALQNEGFTTWIEETELQQNETFTFEVEALGEGPLIASISWTDVAGEYINRGELNNQTKALINDLDIRVVQKEQTYFPWKLDPSQANSPARIGDNSVDPFERIDVQNAKGKYTIIVTHKGTLKNGPQDFSLAVSGIKVSKCSLSIPSDFGIRSLKENDGAMLSWSDAEETLFEVYYRKTDETSWAVDYTWDTMYALDQFQLGEEYEMKVRGVCTESKLSDFSETILFVFEGRETDIEKNGTFTYSGALGMNVYPNPTVNEFEIDADLSEDAVYSIVSTSGTIVKKGDVTDKISVTDLAAGLYILVVQDYSGIQTTKFYKN